MATVTVEAPSTSKLELRTALGPVYRTVLNKPPRDCTNEEIPIIDLSRLFSDSLEDRKDLAKEVYAAAVANGFFYIKNHGIPDETIAAAREQGLNFFHQPPEAKAKASLERSKYFNGWRSAYGTRVNVAESWDTRESFTWRYRPEYDPSPKPPLAQVPDEVKPFIRGEDFVWDETAHLAGFREAVLAYWSACITLARRLVRVFALALDLPEDYFDTRTTYPGADGVLNWYPPSTEEEVRNDAVGLGSHTDLQLFTLLWQDHIGGLQVLTKEGQWIKAKPVEGTIIVNIGDFLMRLSNDIFKSNVHRVYNRSREERVSMPFFFGLNFNCVEGVIPTCTSAENPAKYEPISCGDWCQLRFKQERDDSNKVQAAREKAPSAVVVPM
ncbi:putative 2og-fe oxygenase superfamily protein [Neofusicoccum parvum UCRNP2]|uniref:Fe2OG dioxygenase domain-containing protein n=2 Tax=Neofusicoccum TaxID=407951 RepID=A0ABR3SCB7_9PEZI|nr:putative 2og-fe oxygenase superfamily protein [Neofusicoccum parvum UCRNP2]